ncbi:MAG: 30S ribosomal protein S6 [Kiritimatiellia bacterium]|nr:30S ribosomal protein S6 [Lentisphaerota bacterium]
MKKYEGMFIFYPKADDQALEEKTGVVTAEITKLGGVVNGVTRMGRATFARPMKKSDAGIYVLINFELDPLSVDQLRKRYRLNEDVLRVQIFQRRTAPPVAAEPAAAQA